MIALVSLATLLLLSLPVGTSSCEDGGRSDYARNATVVYVDTRAERDDSCLPPHGISPCASLEAIASGITSMENLTSLEIVICSPRLELKEPVKFEGLSVVRIVGAPTQIQCVSNSSAETSGNNSAGAVFVAVQDLSIEDISFVHCGAFINYTEVWNGRFTAVFRAALHALNCTNVTVRNITASQSNGAGMVVSNVQGGLVNISDSLFEHNAIPVDDRERYAGGGGIFVRILHSIPSHYVLHGCTFVNNTPSTTGEYVFVSIFGRVLRGRGQGGGLLVRISHDATNNSLTVSNCSFIRNSAFLGGGLGIVMSGRSRNNLAVVSSSYIEENGCQPGQESGSAGGAHLGYSYYGSNKEHARDSRIIVRDTIFTKNCAILGGGTTFFASRSDYPDSNNGISFINCSWIENSGHIGAAVDLSPHTDDRLSAGFLPTPNFTDCRFSNNSVRFHMQELQQAIGTGAMFSSLLNIRFISSVHFEQNADTALIIVNAMADFSSCDATFVNNTGVQGGAISLVGVSSMVIGPGHVYQFLHNKATDRGGAISSYLIDNHDFSGSRSCFIQYSERSSPMEWNTSIVFDGNKAPVGRSVFTTATSACLLSGLSFSFDSETTINKSFAWHSSEVLRWPGVFHYDDPAENQIATDGSLFHVLGELPFEIIPGEQHSLEVNITDDLGQLSNSTLRASVEGREIEVDSAFSCVADQIVQLKGTERMTGKLLLQTVSLKKSSILVPIVLAPCPPGFSLNREKECVCDVSSYEGLTRCDFGRFSAYIREGFWVGYVNGDSTNENELVTAFCPVEFCQYSDSVVRTDILLPRTSSNGELDAFICGPSRTGVLCGDCTEGHSAYYHSLYFSCRENNLCSIGWLLYVLSELVPVTFLFVVVLAFNISFTSGKLNGFIFFCQLLDTLFIDVNKVPKVVHFFSLGYRVIYGFFSLDFFTIEPLSFCLWEGATVLDVLAFKYVTIAYSLILVILVIVFMKYFARRLLGNRIKISTIQVSVIHGLSAFLVVCYMQCIKVSLSILLPSSLQGRGGTPLSPARVWLSGEVEVFSPEHLPYAIPALLCLLTVGAIPPIVLLAYPLNNKIASLVGFNTISHTKLAHLMRKVSLNKLKPVLDSFQGCFKDNLRFFAGLYFVYRWVSLFAYSVSPDLNVLYAVLQVLLILMLLIHSVAQPYVNRSYNIVDALLLTDLVLINMLTAFNYYYTRVIAEEVRDQQVIDVTTSFQLILIYLPILAMCVYLMIKGYKKLCSKKKAINKRDTMGERFTTSLDSSVKSRDSRVTMSDIGSLEEFPARLLEEYHEMEPEEEETNLTSPGLPPSIPPAYDPL